MSVVGLNKVPENDISRYGVISIDEYLQQKLFLLDGIIEKPQKSIPPSNLAVFGRYVLSQHL